MNVCKNLDYEKCRSLNSLNHLLPVENIVSPLRSGQQNQQCSEIIEYICNLLKLTKYENFALKSSEVF